MDPDLEETPATAAATVSSAPAIASARSPGDVAITPYREREQPRFDDFPSHSPGPVGSTPDDLEVPLSVSSRGIYDLSAAAISPPRPVFDSISWISEPFARLDEVDWLGCEPLLIHFTSHLSDVLTIAYTGSHNPFQQHVLPIARTHDGVLHAVLGLSACHLYFSGKDESQRCLTTALQHRVEALHSLSELLLKAEISDLDVAEEECVLAMALLLVFHDICESGISSHGAHLTGVSFLCSKLARPTGFSTRSKASMFFLTALSWLDVLRGFSGAEKLAYSDSVRQCVRDHGSLNLHSLVGCPPPLFYRIGQVLQAGRAYLAGDMGRSEFEVLLADSAAFLRAWDPAQATYPTSQDELRLLATAFRHACLLRVLRFPDTFAVPCDDPRVCESVTAILDVAAQIGRDSVFYKRLLFPLFLAGADTVSPHQVHYAGWCINEIKHSTGFQHPAMTELLAQVWEARRNATMNLADSHGNEGSDGQRQGANVPWMEFTCSTLIQTQHAYLFL